MWWHRFEGANSSSRSFTGWQHAGPPTMSMRFTELVIQRFDGGFQAAPDVLDVYSGFYRQASAAEQYDERNEVPLLPSAVMADFWALDFATLVEQRTERFWREHSDDFSLLTRVRFLASVEDALSQGQLLEVDRQRLYRYLGADPREPLTLTALKEASGTEVMRVSQFQTGKGQLYTLTADDGRTVLYTPTASPVLRAFASHEHLLKETAAQLRGPQGQAWVDELYRFDGQSTALARGEVLKQLHEHLGMPGSPQWPFGAGQTVTSNLFVELVAQAKADLRASHAALVSNTALRKQLWRGYLGAFMQVVGGMAPMAWPISLALVGAGVASLALDIDAAVHARSAQARKGALLSAVADAVATLFAMVDVGMGTSALGFRAPPHERLGGLAPWQPVERPLDDLTELSVDSAPPSPAPASRGSILEGVNVLPNGRTWVDIGGKAYQVRYSPELGSWLAVNADAPFAFAPLRPVRLGEDGHWQWLGIPRLAGGAPGELETVSSPFWDFYMEENEELSRELSQMILQRHRAVLDQTPIVEVEADASPRLDDHGYEYVLDETQRHYTYRQAGNYYNDLVQIYTDEMTEANKLFRYGNASFGYGDGDLPAYLRMLCDSLESLPHSNAAMLWRGGNAARGTSGLHLRSGALKVGDVLVTTDFTSFSENPYVVRDFASSSRMNDAGRLAAVFDESSVVFELPYQGYQGGVPIAPFSQHDLEAETLFLPGHYLRIESVSEIHQPTYRFVWVRLREVPKPTTGPVYDLRTGEVFDRAAYAIRVGDEELVERLFPIAQWAQ